MTMAEIQRFHVGPRLSETAVHNGTVYLAGQVPDDTTADIRGQTAQVLAMIDKLLAEAGSDKTCILMTQIFLTDIAEIGAMNEVWDAWVPAGHTPPRATVQAALANKGYKIEVVVTAAQRRSSTICSLSRRIEKRDRKLLPSST
jgi:enamine deaminase RidA (YjgF/YER057c/UK114 family)